MSSRITGMQRLYWFLHAYVTIWDHYMSFRMTGMQRLYWILHAYVTIWDRYMSSRMTGGTCCTNKQHFMLCMSALARNMRVTKRTARVLKTWSVVEVACRYQMHCFWLWGHFLCCVLLSNGFWRFLDYYLCWTNVFLLIETSLFQEILCAAGAL